MLKRVHAWKNQLKDVWTRFRGKAPPAEPPPPPRPPIALDYYVRSAPNAQNALDIFQGEWSSALPGEYTSLLAGTARLFEDVRINWAEEQLGGFRNKAVLELGPLEGGHTYMLEKLGAASVVAVEANTRAYLKCLITKELFQLRRCRFLCGDLMEYLRASPDRFDVGIASGVLYHLRSPVELIARLARRCDRLFLWTHYHDAGPIEKHQIIANRFTGTVDEEYGGFRRTLHRFEYRHAVEWNGYCGGTEDYSCWMSRDDILACLRWFGYGEVRIGFEEPDYPHGPCFALAARRHAR